MGRWTYYAPLAIGAGLVFLLNDAMRAALVAYETWQAWLIIAGIALGVGLQCQVLMVGAQGAFAQVLPVLGGRSIRGGSAVAGGWLLIAWVVASGVTVMLGYEAVSTAAVVMGVVSAAALVGFGLLYAWNIPAALPDFRSRD